MKIKRILMVLLTLMLAVGGVKADTNENLWSGELALDWYPNVINLNTDDFSDAHTGDVISITVSAVSGSWAQFNLSENDTGWPLLLNKGGLSVGVHERSVGRWYDNGDCHHQRVYQRKRSGRDILGFLAGSEQACRCPCG